MRRSLIYLLGGLAALVAPLTLQINRNLEYEYAFSTTIVFALIAFLVPLSKTLSHQTLVVGKKPILLSLVVWPTLPFFWSLFADPVCSPRESLLWLLINLTPSLMVLTGFMLAMSRWRESLDSKTKFFFIWSGLLFVFVIVPSMYLWFFPQKRITTLLFGFIHGPIYDLWIPVDESIVLLRALHGFIGLGLIWLFLARPSGLTKKSLIVCTLLCLVASQFDYSKASLGHGHAAIKNELNGTIEGDLYRIHYDESRIKEKGRNYLKDIQHQADFHIHDMIPWSSIDHKVDIYVYNNSSQKKLLFGGGATDLADVVSPSIHIQLEPWPHSTLRHELVHAITSGDAYFGLGFHPNMALTEGIATALAPNIRDFSENESVSSLIKQNKLPDMNRIFGPLFWLESGRIAYRTAASFLLFLKETYGPEPVLKLYNGKAWGPAFGKSRDDLVTTWKQSFAKWDEKKVSPYEQKVFRFPGVFRDQCPHSKASLQPRSDIFPSWRQPKDWSYQKYLDWRLAINPNDQAIKLALWRWRLRNQEDSSSDLFPANRLKYLEDFQQRVTEVDRLMITGDYAGAENLLLSVFEKSQTTDLGLSLTRQIVFRTLVLKQLEQTQYKEIFAYLMGSVGIPKDFLNKTWLHKYLYIRSKAKIKNQTLGLLVQEELPDYLTDNLRFEWFRWIGQRAMRQGDFELGKQAFNEALKFSHNGAKRAIALFRTEAAWLAAKKHSM
ncbi:MAG: hypothetical protein HRU19_06225 [Pseudobacteriovorax sp.]|nr:hypothetical protein [Pseudobacteriovorax sp.]